MSFSILGYIKRFLTLTNNTFFQGELNCAIITMFQFPFNMHNIDSQVLVYFLNNNCLNISLSICNLTSKIWANSVRYYDSVQIKSLLCQQTEAYYTLAVETTHFNIKQLKCW